MALSSDLLGTIVVIKRGGGHGPSLPLERAEGDPENAPAIRNIGR